MVTLNINGRDTQVDADPSTPILWALRDNLNMTGTKFGCGAALCGACTVHLNGQPIRSCVTPMSNVNGHDVITIDGLGTVENPHPIQTAFITEQAMHCAFCISGPMLYGKAFIDKNPNASEADIAQSLTGLLCRCYAHTRMIQALVNYAKGIA